MIAAQRFADRADAGRSLARRLSHYARRDDVLVLALPRGGVPVAHEIAKSLEVPLDVLVVRKLGVPGHEELAMGAIAAGIVVLDESMVRVAHVEPEMVDAVVRRQRQEVDRQEFLYRGDREALDLKKKVVILVDDGLATGSTMRAAVEVARRSGSDRIIVAVPVASKDACESLGPHVDEVVCVVVPDPFYAVGAWYGNFAQVSDDEVRDLLRQSQRKAGLS